VTNLDQVRTRNFLTVAEAAAFFEDCDERTIRRAIDAGQLPAVRLGTKTLIPVPPLLALLNLPESPVEIPTTGISPEIVAGAVEMVKAGLRVLEPLVRAKDVSAHENEGGAGSAA
jgi:excisionase family DNA binding protein